MKTKLLILFLTLSICPFLIAQKSLDEIINDKDVAWIAVYESYLGFDMNTDLIDSAIRKENDFIYSLKSGFYRSQDVYSKETMSENNILKFGVLRLKQIFNPDVYADEDNFSNYQCNKYLLEWSRTDKIKAYADSDLKVEITATELKKIGVRYDSIVVLDPETLEEINQIVVNDIDPAEITKTKIKYYIYFNKKSSNWKIFVKSIAPIARRYDNNGDYIGESPLFWLEVENQPQKLDYSSADYPEVRRTYITLPYENANTIKKSSTVKECNELLINTILKSPKDREFYRYWILNEKNRISEIKDILTSTDSIYIVDPETFEEVVKVVNSTASAEEIREIRFVQDWFWDVRNKKLRVNFLSYAPIFDKKDNDGNLIAFMPLFFEKMIKDKKKKK